jgi:hypothetical protein
LAISLCEFSDTAAVAVGALRPSSPGNTAVGGAADREAGNGDAGICAARSTRDFGEFAAICALFELLN